jgi:hypothetical protein
MSPQVQEIQRASFGKSTFRTESSQADFKMNDACIMTRYITEESGTESIGYRIIMRMFIHKLFDSSEDPNDEKIVIQARWYECVGVNPVNGLPQIKHQPNFDACSVAFLENCVPENLLFLQSNPWDEECELLDVIISS